MPSSTRRFLDRFINNYNAYAVQNPQGGYFAKRNSVITDEIFQRHLMGVLTVGIYSTNPDHNTSKWLCLDIDEDAETHIQYLTSWLSGHRIIYHRESIRPGRSGHIWIFFAEPLPTAAAFKLGLYLCSYARLSCEQFPKQAAVNPGQLGNLVRLPLGKHQKPAANGVRGLFQDCPSITPAEQLLWFIEQPINDSQYVIDLVTYLPDLSPKPSQKRKTTVSTPLLAEFPADWPMRALANGEIEARCPKCADEGHDVQCKNLSINPEKNVLNCFYGHKFIDIMRSLKAVIIN